MRTVLLQDAPSERHKQRYGNARAKGETYYTLSAPSPVPSTPSVVPRLASIRRDAISEHVFFQRLPITSTDVPCKRPRHVAEERFCEDVFEQIRLSKRKSAETLNLWTTL